MTKFLASNLTSIPIIQNFKAMTKRAWSNPKLLCFIFTVLLQLTHPLTQ